MHVEERLGARAFVQRIDILRHDKHFGAGRGLPQLMLKPGQGQMRAVRQRVYNVAPALIPVSATACADGSWSY